MIFSIIIPNYNNAYWLRGCLDSILAQKFDSHEVIFIDDMSTDGSLDIAREYIGKIKHLTICECRRKAYNGGARNKGLAFASGDYVLFLDSDDQLADDLCLAEVYKAIEENNRPDLVRLSYYWCKNGEEVLNDCSAQDTVEKIVHNESVACWTKCVKRSKVVPFPENTLMEDVVQHIAQLDNVQTVAAIAKGIVKWNRDNWNSCSTDKDAQNGKWCSSLYRYYADLLDLRVTKPECEAELGERRIKALYNIQNSIFEQG